MQDQKERRLLHGANPRWHTVPYGDGTILFGHACFRDISKLGVYISI